MNLNQTVVIVRPLISEGNSTCVAEWHFNGLKLDLKWIAKVECKCKLLSVVLDIKQLVGRTILNVHLSPLYCETPPPNKRAL